METKAKTKTPCKENNQEAEYLPGKSDHTEKQMIEMLNAKKANNETMLSTKKKTCHNRHMNQILQPGAASADGFA